jgi:hypothetical protein
MRDASDAEDVAVGRAVAKSPDLVSVLVRQGSVVLAECPA